MGLCFEFGLSHLLIPCTPSCITMDLMTARFLDISCPCSYFILMSKLFLCKIIVFEILKA